MNYFWMNFSSSELLSLVIFVVVPLYSVVCILDHILVYVHGLSKSIQFSSRVPPQSTFWREWLLFMVCGSACDIMNFVGEQNSRVFRGVVPHLLLCFFVGFDF